MKISNNRRPGDVVKQLDTIAGQMKKTERSQQSKRCIGRRKVVAYETCAFYFVFVFVYVCLCLCLFLSANISLRVEKQWHMRCDHCLLWGFCSDGRGGCRAVLQVYF